MIQIEFDGLCEPNPDGDASIGWVVRVDGKEKHSGHKCIGEGAGMTNNYAEWCALGFALAYLHEYQPLLVNGQELRIVGDSQLVVKQLPGEYQTKAPKLQRLRGRCLDLLRLLAPTRWEAVWVPREQNDRADRLSRQAYRDETGQPCPERRKN